MNTFKIKLACFLQQKFMNAFSSNINQRLFKKGVVAVLVIRLGYLLYLAALAIYLTVEDVDFIKNGTMPASDLQYPISLALFYLLNLSLVIVRLVFFLSKEQIKFITAELCFMLYYYFLIRQNMLFIQLFVLDAFFVFCFYKTKGRAPVIF